MFSSIANQYDANDRLTAGYGYDADGSTTTDPNGNTFTYDSLDRLTSISGTTNESFAYDGDGNKVSHTINGVTTNYLVDTHNLTGYAQVLDVLQSGSVNKTYTYGLNRIAEDQLISGNWTMNYYGYDGQGSVRYLMDTNGNVTDTYTYDAFGNQISKTGTTANVFLYDGEQLDTNTGFYNLRARWMNPTIGRFQSIDSYEGEADDPLSLHKYLFVANNPMNLSDPEGHEFDIGSVGMSLAIVGTLASFPNVAFANTVSAETKIIELIQDFNNASADTGIPVNVLGSLGWSESPNWKLGYWDSNAKPAYGIMQLNDPKYAGLSDADNIETGAQILKQKAALHITHHLYRRNITPAELIDPWYIPVVLYKVSYTLADDWDNKIYKSWPLCAPPYGTNALFQKLWREDAH